MQAELLEERAQLRASLEQQQSLGRAQAERIATLEAGLQAKPAPQEQAGGAAVADAAEELATLAMDAQVRRDRGSHSLSERLADDGGHFSHRPR